MKLRKVYIVVRGRIGNWEASKQDVRTHIKGEAGGVKRIFCRQRGGPEGVFILDLHEESIHCREGKDWGNPKKTYVRTS